MDRLITHNPADIGKRECELLIENLIDVKYPEAEVRKIAANYGYDPYAGTWDDTKFQQYKDTLLTERMSDPARNYTFILLQEEGKTVALASFNAPEDKSQLRVLNFTVDREHRGDIRLLKRLGGEIVQYAMENGFEGAKINGPMSGYSVTAGNHKAYQRLAQRYGLETELTEKDGEALLAVTPKAIDLKPESQQTR